MPSIATALYTKCWSPGFSMYQIKNIRDVDLTNSHIRLWDMDVNPIEETKLLVIWRKIWRKILGLVLTVDGVWRLSKNKDNIKHQDIKKPNIVGEIKSHRLCWLGYVEIMEKDRAVKRTYLGRPSGQSRLDILDTAGLIKSANTCKNCRLTIGRRWYRPMQNGKSGC